MRNHRSLVPFVRSAGGAARFRVASALLVTVCALPSCDGDSEADPDADGGFRDVIAELSYELPPEVREERLEQDACMHFAEGPFVSLTADASPEPRTARLEETHTTYVIDLVPQDGDALGGFVAFSVGEADRYFFFLDSGLGHEVTSVDGGTGSDVETGVGSAVCTLGTWSISELSPGEYRVQLGPGAFTSVQAVWMRAGEIPHE
jgi:hypothetical protein